MRIEQITDGEKDTGHIELHIIPLSTEHCRRVVLARGGNVESDKAVPVSDLAAHIARILTTSAIPDNVVTFVRNVLGKK